MTNRMSIFIAAAAVVILAGCSNFDGPKIRKQQAEDYQKLLDKRTEEVLSGKESLNLQDCITAALGNNLDIRVAEVRQRVAQLNRDVSFSQFLPRVNFNYNYTRWDPQPEIVTGATSQPMHDERIRDISLNIHERIRDISLNIQMSVFNPSTWFMYSMHKRGEEIAEIAADYTRQMIVLQVTTYYYYCLGLQEVDKVLDSRIRAAQLQDYQAEGMVFEWQSDQARVNLESQKLQRKRISQLLDQTEGQLLMAMGLSPLGSIQLQPSPPTMPPQGELDDFIAEAMLNHPRLRIADLEIAIEKEKVKTALTGFMPSLTGFANRVNTTDAFQRYSSYWMMGLSGVLTVFNGFANINQYEAAKENVKKAALVREQTTLALMLEVYRAYQNLQLAQDSIALVQYNEKAANAHYDQVYEQWQEGLVDASGLLSVVAEKDLAQMAKINSQFQVQVALATLVNVMGQTEIDYEEAQHDGQS